MTGKQGQTSVTLTTMAITSALNNVMGDSLQQHEKNEQKKRKKQRPIKTKTTGLRFKTNGKKNHTYTHTHLT